MKLIIASNNAHKVREIREILGDFFPDMKTLKEAGLSIDVEEDGDTFAANAKKKAEETLLAAPGFDAALADDSGLMVDHLNGAPGVYSARYAGEQHCDADNNAKLMADMAGVPDDQRGCQFVACIALARRGKPTITATGIVRGRLLCEAVGENGFGYDPYFFYEPAGLSFAQIAPEEKNAVSHRHNALILMKEMLEKEQQA